MAPFQVPSRQFSRKAAVPERIRKASISLFRQHGYHGTTLRLLARVVRMEVGSLYYYFPSKQDILCDILDRTMDYLIQGVQQAIQGISGPPERLRAAVRFHVLSHARRGDEIFISRSELRSLRLGNLRRTLIKRDRYEGIFRALLATGVEAGVFDIGDVPVATMAILTMCSGVADWFSERGRLGAEAVADVYAGLVLRAVGAPGVRDQHAGSGYPNRNDGTGT